jgi:hypothetical protein
MLDPLVILLRAVHQPFGCSTDNRATERPDGCTHRTTRQTNDAAGDCARGRRATRGGVRLTCVGVPIFLHLVVVWVHGWSTAQRVPPGVIA